MSSSDSSGRRRVAIHPSVNSVPVSIPASVLRLPGPSSTSEQTRFSACLNKCRTLQGDLEVTATALEQLLIENSWSHSAIEMEINELRKIFDDFTAAHLEMMRLCEAADLDTKPHLDRRQRFLTRYKHIRNQLLTHAAPSVSTSQVQDTTGNSGLKLPKVEIPTYDGDFDQWTGWYNLYENLIHNNSSLKPMSKFSYLRSFLKGVPLTLVQGYPFEESFYEAAFKSVVDHYNDPLRRVSRLLNQLQETPTMKDKKQTLRGLISSFRATATSIQIMFRENEDIDPLSQMLIHAFLSKADKGTRQDWEREVMRRKKFASVEEFIEYMEARCNAYERAIAGSSNSSNSTPAQSSNSKFNTKSRSNVLSTASKKAPKCYNCAGDHTIYKCAEFLKLSIADRQKYIKTKDWCLKCISPKCNKKCSASCKICRKGHNVLIHESKGKAQVDKTPEREPSGKIISSLKICQPNVLATDESTKFEISNLWIGNISRYSNESLLATAEVKIFSHDNKIFKICRALLDSASQSNLINKNVSRELKLKPFSAGSELASIQGQQSSSEGCIYTKISAIHSQFSMATTFEIVDEIIDLVPQATFSTTQWNIPKGINLADPKFHVANKVDILLGLRIFWRILGNRKIHLGRDLPDLQSSSLGWLVADHRDYELPPVPSNKRIFATQTIDSLASTIQRFWFVDELNANELTFEEIECEKEFSKNSVRTLLDVSGYFTVHLPFKNSPDKLGYSRSLALRQFYSLEKRLAKNKKLKLEYSAGMHDYLKEKHMVEVNELFINSKLDELAYYMPHHAVVKETSTSTRVRTVFNASSATTSGLSLNDCLMVGPVIQSDLITVILRFRTHKYAFTADITKMYRQVRLYSDHTRFQRIFWRDDPSLPLKVYEIVTLAFGTASAPFLATRCLKALVELDGPLFPKACSPLLHDFYVDDVLTGAETIEEAQQIQLQLQEILLRGGFKLNKWCANSPDLLANIPSAQHESKFPFSLDKEDKTIKSLGLLWSSKNDLYKVKVNIDDFETARSKRHILSIIASIFDPIGFLAPVTITAKLLIQTLWTQSNSPCSKKSNTHWDEEISDELYATWVKFASTLGELHNVSIPRYLFYKCSSYQRIEMHGFSDASQKAYGAVVYIRAIGNDGTACSLYFSKSKVAPIKIQTIPRLELCAAVLLTEIVEKVQCALKDLIKIDVIRLWSDSQVVLHWIASPPSRWLPFVANRVQKVQKASQNCHWDYVHTKSNPADLISRGITPEDLKNSTLWWNGPNWLSEPTPFDTKTSFVAGSKIFDVEMRRSKRLLTFATTFRSTIFELSSNYWKLIRLVAWISRFIINSHCLGPLFSGRLQISELRESTNTLVKIAQNESFSDEMKCLLINREIPKTSPLISLSPFLDNGNLIRVGGRLQNSDLTFDHQHPLVLDPKHKLSKIIIKHYHELHFHAGPQLLRSIIRRKFWILRINSAIQNCILNCNKCVRMKANTMSQAMAALPKNRITPARPFSITGVDYAGPFMILAKGGKHKVSTKAYISVFVCFVTKALHLELVSDLTTDAFFAALNRFISRRGMPTEIWSDNGTNFVGTKNLLKRNFIEFLSSNTEEITAFSQKRECAWNFIPPYSPHFGGLWEAGVKSVKGHLKFILTNNHFTFEQWATVITQIEACLNSRPLIADSSDPNEPRALTPGHFLIGGPIVALPTPDLSGVKENRLKHWEKVQAQTQRFWKRWKTEYLNTLQQRTKWRVAKKNIQINDIVILKEDNSPPTNWPLGRITELHSGNDGLTRVVSIQIYDKIHDKTIIVKRPLVKIVLLPKNDESQP